MKWIGVLIGAMIFIGGLYYRNKEKNDAEAQKIYTIASIVGLAFCIFMLVGAL